MMKRLIPMLVLACMFAPATARANSGGFWDFLYGLDPKLTGVGTDVHVACYDDKGNKLKNCEELWGFRRADQNEIQAFKDLKHEINLRFAFYWEYGASYDKIFNADSMHAFTFVPMYVYHADKHISVGLGAGSMSFWGDSAPNTPFNKFTKFIVTPLSVTYSPATAGFGGFFIRGEATYIKKGISPSDFNSALPTVDRAGEWNVSFATGFDLRRR